MTTETVNFAGADANPYTAPAGWTIYGTMRRYAHIPPSGGVIGVGFAQMVFDTYVPGVKTITSTMVHNAADASDEWGFCFIIPDGTGFSLIATNTTIKLRTEVARSPGVTIATVAAANTADESFSVRYDDVSGDIVVKKAGTVVLTGNYTDTPNLLAGIQEYRNGASAQAYTSVSLDYVINLQSITSINGGSPIKFGQTGVPIVAAGFPAKPTGVTATYASGAQSITATIDAGGDKDNFAISIQDRVEAEDWPLDGATVTYTFTHGELLASGTNAISKRTGETKVIYASAIIDDSAALTYWLDQDGFNTEGASLIYTQPAATGTMPTPDLALDTAGGGSVSEACTFDSYFRPIADKSGYAGRAGNVYFYRWTITTDGVVVDTTPDPFTFGSVTGVAPSAVTPAASSITVAGVIAATDVLAVATGGLSYRVSTDDGITFGSWTTASTNVRLGYVIEARVTASSSTSALVTGTLTIGGVAGTLQVTTRAGINIPNQMIFASFLDSELLTEHTSSIQTVAGMDTGESSAFTIANGTYSKNGGAFVSTAGVMQNGDTFTLRGTSDTYFGRTVSVTLTAANGSVASTYKIVNKYDPLISGNGGSNTKLASRKITCRKI